MLTKLISDVSLPSVTKVNDGNVYAPSVHDAWLRELERSLDMVCKKIPSLSKESSSGEDNASLEVDATPHAEVVGESANIPAALTDEPLQGVPVSGVASVEEGVTKAPSRFDVPGVPTTSFQTAGGAAYEPSFDVRVDEARAQASETRVFDHVRYAASSLNLMASESGAFKVSIRDAGMSLESELSLLQKIKEGLGKAGVNLDGAWVNGRVVYTKSSGEDHGN